MRTPHHLASLALSALAVAAHAAPQPARVISAATLRAAHQGTPVPAPSPASAPAPGSEWRPYTPSDSSFRALLPGTPDRSIQRDGLSEDRPVEHLYVLSGSPVVYVVEYTDELDAALKAFGPQRLLAGFEWGFFRESAGRVTGVKSLTVAGAPGREVRITTVNGRSMFFRSCIIGGRFYHWGTSTEAGKDGAADTERFMASFVPGVPGVSGASARSAAPSAGAASAAAPRKPEAKKPAGPRWKELRFAEAGFSIQVPTRPADGAKPDTAAVTIRPAGKHAPAAAAKQPAPRKLNFLNEAESYSVSWEAAPADGGDGGDSLWDLGARAAASLHGKLLVSSPLQKPGCAGAEFHVQVPEDLGAVIRVYRGAGRIYTLTAITPMERSYSDGTVRFLGSFRLLDAQSPGKVAAAVKGR